MVLVQTELAHIHITNFHLHAIYFIQNSEGTFSVLHESVLIIKIVEKAAEAQTSIWLASHFVRGPNSRSGGREFESSIRLELGALTESGKILGVRSL